MSRIAVAWLSLFSVLAPMHVLTIAGNNIAFMNLRIYNYKNDLDVMYKGKPCDRYQRAGDFCDPMFHVCVTSDTNNRCNVLVENIRPFLNSKTVAVVSDRGNIPLKTFPNMVRIDVKVRDFDVRGDHDNIAHFFQYIKPTTNSTMVRFIRTERFFIEINFQVSFSCASNYYGNQCEIHCIEDGYTYKCHKSTGRKYCILPCMNGGTCIFSSSRNGFTCVCLPHYRGNNCEEMVSAPQPQFSIPISQVLAQTSPTPTEMARPTNVGFMNLTIFGYENYLDQKANGKQCDSWLLIGDNCDPMFDICVTSDNNARCNILSERIGPFINTKEVAEILKKINIGLKKFPESVRVDVIISDSDSVGNNDHIAAVTEFVKTTTKRTLVTHRMSRRLRIKINFQVSFSCASNYYGNQCRVYCLEDGYTYKCDRSTGHRYCILPCYNGGKCLFSHSRRGFACRCLPGYRGIHCDEMVSTPQPHFKTSIRQVWTQSSRKTTDVTKPINAGFMNLRILGYENYLDRKANGKRCESMSWMGDNCDPMFDICVTSDDNSRCNILRERIGHFSDTKVVAVILKKNNIGLKMFPKTVRVDVGISDYDSSGNHDHIAGFIGLFKTTTKGTLSERKISGRHNIRIILQASFSCAKNYYGDLCDTYCLQDGRTYMCSNTGEKICVLPCSNRNECSFNISRNRFQCRCQGFIGDICTAPRHCTSSDNPCLNGATCLLANLPSQRYTYYCVCTPGYNGNHCERVVTAQPMTTSRVTQSPSAHWKNKEMIQEGTETVAKVPTENMEVYTTVPTTKDSENPNNREVKDADEFETLGWNWIQKNVP